MSPEVLSALDAARVALPLDVFVGLALSSEETPAFLRALAYHLRQATRTLPLSSYAQELSRLQASYAYELVSAALEGLGTLEPDERNAAGGLAVGQSTESEVLRVSRLGSSLVVVELAKAGLWGQVCRQATLGMWDFSQSQLDQLVGELMRAHSFDEALRGMHQAGLWASVEDRRSVDVPPAGWTELLLRGPNTLLRVGWHNFWLTETSGTRPSRRACLRPSSPRLSMRRLRKLLPHLQGLDFDSAIELLNKHNIPIAVSNDQT